MGKLLVFTSDFTWDVSLASDFISENSWKKSDFHKLQAIRKMSIRKKWNPVGLRKIFIWIFTCENADIPYNFLYGASLVLHLCKRTCPTGFTRWITSETRGTCPLAQVKNKWRSCPYERLDHGNYKS